MPGVPVLNWHSSRLVPSPLRKRGVLRAACVGMLVSCGGGSDGPTQPAAPVLTTISVTLASNSILRGVIDRDYCDRT